MPGRPYDSFENIFGRMRKGNAFIVLPAVVTIILFIAATVGYFLPRFEELAWSKKRDVLRELTNAPLTALDHYYTMERNGDLTRRDAQEAAKSLIRDMRYGVELKDYYWIM